MNLPATLLGGAQEGGKARPRIEARQAQPIDAAVTADERGGVGVADQRVILDFHDGWLVGAEVNGDGSRVAPSAAIRPASRTTIANAASAASFTEVDCSAKS